MTQTKLSSLIEACIGTAIGFLLSMVLGLIVYPLFGHSFSMSENLGITAIFTVASIGRSYVVRRWFNARIHRASVRMSGGGV